MTGASKVSSVLSFSYRLTHTMLADNDPVSDSTPEAQQTLARAADLRSCAYMNDLF